MATTAIRVLSSNGDTTGAMGTEGILDIGSSRTAIIDWIREPSVSTGLYIADADRGWHYRPYVELADLSKRIAGRLAQDGLRAERNACVIMPTGAICVGTLYATWLCGATATLIAPPMFGEEAGYVAHVAAILRETKAHTIVTSPELAALITQAAVTVGFTRTPVIIDDAAAQAASPLEPREPGNYALVQFTSGSTSAPRGVVVSWENLRDNVRLIMSKLDWRPGDATASWLPLYHDMGLVGSLLVTIASQGNLYLMRPDQFIRDPIRWLDAMTKAQHTASPSFGVGYAARKLSPQDVVGLNLSGWRSLVVGAEPVDLTSLSAFCGLTDHIGFNPSAITAAYGLAEATLMVTATPASEPVAALRINNASLRMGAPVEIIESTAFTGRGSFGDGWIAGLGPYDSIAYVVDDDGQSVPDGTLGQIVVHPSAAAVGYCEGPAERDSAGTRFSDAALYTGDAGFCHGGQLYALGRIGWSLKIRGKSIFMEDLESRLAKVGGLGRNMLCATPIPGTSLPAVALFVERRDGEWLGAVRQAVRADLGPAHMLRVISGPRGFIRRTSSGKPQRARMWQLLTAGELSDSSVLFDSTGMVNAAPSLPGIELTDGRRLAFSQAELNGLLEKTRRIVQIDERATVLLEGSLAEGFGNEASDIDFLVVLPGDVPTPTMPSLAFIDGRRIEVRIRSMAQLARQLDDVARALAEPPPALLYQPGNDLVNRCQRFLRTVVVHRGTTWPDVATLYSRLPYEDFTKLVSGWWHARAQQALRQAVAFVAIGALAEARAWARDGLQQAAKGWAAGKGECYVETKWLPLQLQRIGEQPITDRYSALDAALAEGDVDQTAELLQPAISLAGELGVEGVINDPSLVTLVRMPGVTSWPIGDTLHVLRDDDVFAFSDEAARMWRTVVFGRPVCEITPKRASSGHLAEFVRLGLIGMRWGTGDVIRPAVAMCEPNRPYTCPPCMDLPPVSMAGAPRDQLISLSPLPARRFVECGMNLMWANVLVENAREDFVGAVRSGQWGVAEIAKVRLVRVLVRVVAATCGASPLPADVAALPTVQRLLPHNLAARADLIDAFRQAVQVTFSGSTESGDGASAKIALLDDLVHRVRALSGCEFPASFNSREQWGQTLDAGYGWLRMGSYLNADLPLDEARDLLEAGGVQPLGRAKEVHA